MADVVVEQRIVEGKGDSAGVAEEAFDPLPNHTFEKDFGATHQVRRHCCVSFSSAGLRPATTYQIKKATSRICFIPAGGLRTQFRAASSGAGYGDQNNNADYKELGSDAE